MDESLLSEIAKGIPTYPIMSRPDAPYQIARKEEFYDTRPEKDIVLPSGKEQGKLMPHQVFIARFFSPQTPNKEGLIFYGTGLGKTCLEGAVGEAFKTTTYDGKKRPKILILVPNSTIEHKTYIDIAKKCTEKGVYDALNVPGTKERERKERKNVRTEYRIATLRSELKRIRNMLHNPEKLKEDYDGTILIIDEAHLLRSSSDSKNRRSSSPGGVDVYSTLIEFLRTIDYTRLLLLTATPIWDSAFEIAGLNNILHAKDESKWLPMKKTKFDDEVFTLGSDDSPVLKNREKLKKLWWGKMFYLRQVITGVEKKTMGELHYPLRHIKVVPDVMSDFQNKIAQEQFRKKGSPSPSSAGPSPGSPNTFSDKKRDAAYRDARDAATCVLNDEGDFKEDVDKERSFLNKIGRNPDSLKKYSAKYQAIVESVRKAQEENKCVFIFMRRVTGPGGSIMLGKILDRVLGLTRTITGNHTNEGERYAVISGSEDETTHSLEDIKKLLKNVSKPQNKYGEFVRVVIGSGVVSTGVDIFNIQKVIFPEPHWNLSDYVQALGRVLRVGAYQALLDAGEKPVIDIEHHASVSKDPEELTIDLYIYQIAESKQEQIALLYRLIKEISVDCGLNYRHNVLTTDEDYSMECDFEKCAYHCDGWPKKYPLSKNPELAYEIPPEERTPSKFTSSSFPYRERLEVKKRIALLFQRNFSLWLDEIYFQLKEFHPILVLLSLEDIISSKNILFDNYYFPRYLNEDGNVYFLSSLPSVRNFSLSTYVSRPLLIKRTSLEDLVEVDKNSKTKIKKFLENPTMKSYLSLNRLAVSTLTEKIFELNFCGEWGKNKNEKKILETYVLPLIYKMNDGNYVSTLEASKPSDVSYNVGEKKLLPNGSLRIFYEKYGSWGLSESRDQEKMYIDEIKKKDANLVKERLEKSKYGAYLARSLEDGKVRIVSSKRKGGTICDEKSKEWILGFFLEAVKKGWKSEIAESLRNLSKKEMLNQLKKYMPKTRLDNLNEEKLTSLLEVAETPKETICDELIYELFGNPVTV